MLLTFWANTNTTNTFIPPIAVNNFYYSLAHTTNNFS